VIAFLVKSKFPLQESMMLLQQQQQQQQQSLNKNIVHVLLFYLTDDGGRGNMFPRKADMNLQGLTINQNVIT
jgi:hypothetical protein